LTDQGQPDRGERRSHLEGKRARHLTLLAFAAIALSFVSMPSYGVGPALAVILLIVCAIQRSRGYDVKRPMIAGVSALAISAISAGSCWWFFLRPAEVSGREERRQDRVEQRFEDAFEKKEAAPPPRRLDGGSMFVDDAGTP
jgi:hypothetical protein